MMATDVTSPVSRTGSPSVTSTGPPGMWTVAVVAAEPPLVRRPRRPRRRRCRRPGWGRRPARTRPCRCWSGRRPGHEHLDVDAAGRARVDPGAEGDERLGVGQLGAGPLRARGAGCRRRPAPPASDVGLDPLRLGVADLGLAHLDAHPLGRRAGARRAGGPTRRPAVGGDLRGSAAATTPAWKTAWARQRMPLPLISADRAVGVEQLHRDVGPVGAGAWPAAGRRRRSRCGGRRARRRPPAPTGWVPSRSSRTRKSLPRPWCLVRRMRRSAYGPRQIVHEEVRRPRPARGRARRCGGRAGTRPTGGGRTGRVRRTARSRASSRVTLAGRGGRAAPGSRGPGRPCGTAPAGRSAGGGPRRGTRRRAGRA